jgi:hypothetical protein
MTHLDSLIADSVALRQEVRVACAALIAAKADFRADISAMAERTRDNITRSLKVLDMGRSAGLIPCRKDDVTAQITAERLV